MENARTQNYCPQLTFRGCGDNRRCRVRARRLGSRSGDDARLRRHDDQCHTDAAARRGENGEGLQVHVGTKRREFMHPRS